MLKVERFLGINLTEGTGRTSLVKFAFVIANNVLQVPANTACSCPNDVLTFVCTVVGGGNTLWEGTAFECPANSIILLHSLFSSPGGASGNCGDISGQSIAVEDNCYTSQVTIRVSVGFNNKSVTCIHNSGRGMIPIGGSSLTVMEGILLQ